MKNIIAIVAFSLLLGACGNAQKETNEPVADDNSYRTKEILDSVNASNAVTAANLQRQKSLDSMNQVMEDERELSKKHVAYLNTGSHNTVSNAGTSNSSTNNTSTTAEKKKMSNAKKGALIGAGSGAVLGAVTGVVVDGKKGEGAVVGGLIGAAAGAGAGAAIGHAKDKKNKEEAEK